MMDGSDGYVQVIRDINDFTSISLVTQGSAVDWVKDEYGSKREDKALFLYDAAGLVYIPETLRNDPGVLTRIQDILQNFDVAKGLGGRIRWVANPIFKSVLGSVLANEDYRDQTYRRRKNADAADARKLDGTTVLMEAIERNASDIHIEARRESGFRSRIRLRIDGRLHDMSVISEVQAAKLIRSFFTGQAFAASQLNSEAPGDGMFEYAHHMPDGSERLYTVRLNSVPLVGQGMKLVARLRSPTDVRDLSEAGYEKTQLEIIREVSRYSEGIFLFVGPTNSGKSTSLNAVMASIPPERCVVELADPIEAYLQNCIHISVPSTTEKDRLVSAKLMEATVRQDTDILVLGEVRNEQTVRQASNLSEQGKVVLSTLHTSSVVAIHARLVGLGMKPDLLTLPRFLRGGVAQKLLPVTCSECGIPLSKVKLHGRRKSMVDRLTRIHESAERMRFANPEGCGSCLKGFRGRTLVAEVMTVDDEIRKFFAAKDFSTMERYLLDEVRMTSLRAHAFSKITKGMLDPEVVETTVERIEHRDFRQTSRPREVLAA